MKRTPKDYQGTEPTGKMIGQVLSDVLEKMGKVYKERPDLVLAAWPEIIGEKLAPMTQALSFTGGVLTVKVKNSTLHSLLSQQEKARLLRRLKECFPSILIRNIVFRIG